MNIRNIYADVYHAERLCVTATQGQMKCDGSDVHAFLSAISKRDCGDAKHGVGLALQY